MENNNSTTFENEFFQFDFRSVNRDTLGRPLKKDEFIQNILSVYLNKKSLKESLIDVDTSKIASDFTSFCDKVKKTYEDAYIESNKLYSKLMLENPGDEYNKIFERIEKIKKQLDSGSGSSDASSDGSSSGSSSSDASSDGSSSGSSSSDASSDS